MADGPCPARMAIRPSTSPRCVVLVERSVGWTHAPAREADHLIQGGSDDIEALTIAGDMLVFAYDPMGYVAVDFTSIDATTLLHWISANTEAVNVDRRRAGTGPIHVRRRVQEPSMDAAGNTVFWTIERADETGQDLVNAVTLRLGRHGCEKTVWVGGSGQLSTGRRWARHDAPGTQLRSGQSLCRPCQRRHGRRLRRWSAASWRRLRSPAWS